MAVLRLCALLMAGFLLSGCAEDLRAPYEDIARARHVTQERPYIELLTMVSTRNGRGAHSALLINGSERVLYDPAGTFTHSRMPERGDIHYGATDGLVDLYRRYHARRSHFVHGQKIYVSAETAERIMAITKETGAQPKAFCTQGTTSILQQVRGFQHIRSTFFPENLRREFAAIPGVIDSYTEEQDDDKGLPPA